MPEVIISFPAKPSLVYEGCGMYRSFKLQKYITCIQEYGQTQVMKQNDHFFDKSNVIFSFFYGATRYDYLESVTCTHIGFIAGWWWRSAEDKWKWGIQQLASDWSMTGCGERYLYIISIVPPVHDTESPLKQCIHQLMHPMSTRKVLEHNPYSPNILKYSHYMKHSHPLMTYTADSRE